MTMMTAVDVAVAKLVTDGHDSMMASLALCVVGECKARMHNCDVQN